MTILDRYVLRQVTGVFIFGVGLFTVLLSVNDVFLLARIAVRAHLPFMAVGRLLLLRVPNLAVFSLPVALLLGTLLAFGRLSDHNEVVAMRTGGIGLGRVAVPLLLVAVLVAIAGILLGEWTVPLAEDRFTEELRRLGTRPATPTSYVLFREREQTLTSVYYARGRDESGQCLLGVVVNQFEGDRLVRVVRARQACHREGVWMFEEGTIYQFTPQGTVEGQFTRMKAGIQQAPQQILAQRKDPAQMTVRELRDYMDVLRRAGESLVEYAVWFHARLAIPSSTIAFVLLGIPLGLRPHRSGSSIGLGMAILILAVYYLITNTTLALGQNSRLNPFLAAWTPNLVIGALGGYLLWRAR